MSQEWANNTYFDSSEYLAIKQYIQELSDQKMLFIFSLQDQVVIKV